MFAPKIQDYSAILPKCFLRESDWRHSVARITKARQNPIRDTRSGWCGGVTFTRIKTRYCRRPRPVTYYLQPPVPTHGAYRAPRKRKCLRNSNIRHSKTIFLFFIKNFTVLVNVNEQWTVACVILELFSLNFLLVPLETRLKRYIGFCVRVCIGDYDYFFGLDWFEITPRIYNCNIFFCLAVTIWKKLI